MMTRSRTAARKLPKWSAREWNVYRRGFESGKVIGRADGLELANVPPRSDRVLRVAEVMKLTGLGRTTIWELERRGEFPTRVKRLDSRSRAVGWRASEVARWIAERTAARQA